MLRFVLTLCLLLAAVRPSSALTEGEIQKFIDEAIKAGGGEVVIPPGVHIIEKGLRLTNAKKLRLIGLDAEECVLKGSKDAPALLLIGGSCEEVRIEKLTFESGRDAVAEDPDAAAGNRFSKMLIGRCFFQNQKHAGILLLKAAAEGLEIDGCSFRDIGGDAVHLGHQVSNSQVTHNHFTRCQTGVKLAGSQKCLVASNELSDCETGILIEGPDDKASGDQGNIIAINAIERTSQNAVVIHSGTQNNAVIQNEIRDSKGDGIRISGNKHVVKANQITGSVGKNVAVIEGTHEVVE